MTTTKYTDQSHDPDHPSYEVRWMPDEKPDGPFCEVCGEDGGEIADCLDRETGARMPAHWSCALKSGLQPLDYEEFGEIEASPLVETCPICHAWTDDCRCPLDVRERTTFCEKCQKFVLIVDADSTSGFAGGRIYFTTYDCGHQEVDDSDDVRAAR